MVCLLIVEIKDKTIKSLPYKKKEHSNKAYNKINHTIKQNKICLGSKKGAHVNDKETQNH